MSWHTTSTSPSVATDRSLHRWPSSVRGLWIPGVSRSTICESAVVRTPRTCVRVVCGRDDTIETFVPTSWFTSVDLPTLGRPTRETNPRAEAAPALARVMRSRRAATSPSASSSSSGSSTGMIATEVMRRPSTRSVRNSRPWNRTVSPASGTWPSRLNTRPPTVSHSVSGSSRPEHLADVVDRRPARRAPAPAGERLDAGALDVELVGDLADDLLEQVLERDDARRCRRARRSRPPCGTSRSASPGAAPRPASARARTPRRAPRRGPAGARRRHAPAARGPSGTRARRCRRWCPCSTGCASSRPRWRG